MEFNFEGIDEIIKINFDFSKSELINALEPDDSIPVIIPEKFSKYQIDLFKEILEKINKMEKISEEEQFLSKSKVLKPLFDYFKMKNEIMDLFDELKTPFYKVSYLYYDDLLFDIDEHVNNQLSNLTTVFWYFKTEKEALEKWSDLILLRSKKSYPRMVVKIDNDNKIINITHPTFKIFYYEDEKEKVYKFNKNMKTQIISSLYKIERIDNFSLHVKNSSHKFSDYLSYKIVKGVDDDTYEFNYDTDEDVHAFKEDFLNDTSDDEEDEGFKEDFLNEDEDDEDDT